MIDSTTLTAILAEYDGTRSPEVGDSETDIARREGRAEVVDLVCSMAARDAGRPSYADLLAALKEACDDIECSSDHNPSFNIWNTIDRAEAK